jgi:DNA invertase Pin-like site-specific DNA recombinase
LAKRALVTAGRTRTVAYLRVSTDKQADKGVSLDAQRAKVAAYSALYDLELVDVIGDAGVSAKTLDRPGLRIALEMLKSGRADAVLVVKLDRLTRSVRDLGHLVETYFADSQGPALLSVGEQVDTRTAAGRLVLNVLGAVSQWEREAIGERTASAMRHMQRAGEYTGGAAPIGFRLTPDHRLVQDPSEQAVLAHAQALRAQGLSLQRIASELGRLGYRTRRGRSFASAQVFRMVQAKECA